MNGMKTLDTSHQYLTHYFIHTQVIVQHNSFHNMILRVQTQLNLNPVHGNSCAGNQLSQKLRFAISALQIADLIPQCPPKKPNFTKSFEDRAIPHMAAFNGSYHPKR